MPNKSKPNSSEKLIKKILHVNSLIYIGLYVLESQVKKHLIQALQSVLGPDWLRQELQDSQILLFKEEAALICRRKNQHFILTEKKFLEEASLGFWVELFNPVTYKQLKGAPIKAFEQRPAVIKRKDIYRIFKEVKELRNAIVHNRISLGQQKDKDLLLLNKLQQGDQQTRTLISYLNPAYLRVLPTHFDDKIMDLERMIRGQDNHYL